ncbi:MAG: hypothetical protein C4576_00665 [Desulfobacteraceae bacterium]|nr:MAG: hypothetical protein C4576_00665 [Desulfobacteraceae bacterium]
MFSFLLSALLASLMSLSAAGPALAESGPPVFGSGDRESLQSLLPKSGEIPEIKENSAPEFYVGQNLFDYINGEAETYLDYGFELLVTREYIDKEGSVLTLEIYRMKSPLHGFGIFAAERTPDDQAVELGAQGFQGRNTVAFWKGPYYCKILFHRMSPGLDSVLLKIGRLIAGSIQGEYPLPEIFSFFPEEHRVNGSERFIPRNFLGQPYLKNGFRVDYERAGKASQLFLVQLDTPHAAREAYVKYREFLRSEGDSVAPLGKGSAEMVRVRNGRDRLLFQQGPFFGGVVDEADQVAAERSMQAMVKRLKAKGF